MARALQPVSRDRDAARREFILNTLLMGSLLMSGFVIVLALAADTLTSTARGGVNLIVLVGVFAFFLICWYFSKKGKARVVSYLFIGAYYLLITQLAFSSGSSVPQALLMYALIVVMSGILANSGFSFLMTFIIACTLILLNYLERSGILPVDHPWKQQPLRIADGLVHAVTLIIIAVVSWLFNRESEKAFHRAKMSELALQKERDSLALKVTKKTAELRREQAEKVAQVYKFAEFGKLTSGIVHDLANSVMLVSANLEQVEKQATKVEPLKDAISRAKLGTRQLENFILATRKRLHNQEAVVPFSLNEEMTHVLEILGHKAKSAGVTVELLQTQKIILTGSTSKFHQLMSNLISNAVDAYDGLERKDKQVVIRFTKTKQQIKITVTDFGKGIAKQHLAQIFEPFFSTKNINQGSGIGLSITNDIVTKDFGGSLSVKSKQEKGTQFTVYLPNAD